MPCVSGCLVPNCMLSLLVFTFYLCSHLVKGGCVSLRNWSRVKDSLQSDKYKKRAEWKRDEHGILYKTKLCWFNEHHPQGCPRLAEICPYAHGSKELRKRPDFTKVQ